MSRTLEDSADGQLTSTPTYVDQCRHAVTWSDTISMTSLCDDVEMTSEPAVGVIEWNWRAVPLVALVAAGIVGNTLVCASVLIERRLHNVTNYFLVSLASYGDLQLTFNLCMTFNDLHDPRVTGSRRLIRIARCDAVLHRSGVSWSVCTFIIRGNKRCFCPSVRPSVAYIANNSRTQRPSVFKFGKKVPQFRCDSHTSFKVKDQGHLAH